MGSGAAASDRRFARSIDLIRSRGGAAQLCVIRDGQVLVDQSFGCRPDALFWIFSASKPFVAVAVHQLTERGDLSLDDTVAQHWPEFGQHGKGSITIRQVLQHRSGLPVVHGRFRDAFTATNWKRSIRAIERAPAAEPPGRAPAYHILTYGFILGELVQRVTGRDVAEVIRCELIDPLGLADTSLGLPDRHWPRHVPIQAAGRGRRTIERALNRRATRRAIIPAAGISTTARDLARFYQALLRATAGRTPALLAPATMAEACRPSSDGEIDRILKVPVRWSQGFQLGGPSLDPGRPRPFGRLSEPHTFGHNGSNCCLGWADPSRGLAFAFLTNVLPGGLEGSPHLAEVSDSVLAECS